MNNEILILCYSFPPHTGIGGRRWAKFAKYLSKEKYIINVFNAKNIFNEKSLWVDDVQNNSSIKINSYAFQFQKTLLNPKTIIEKIVRKIVLQLLKFTKYTPDIITSLPNKSYWQGVEDCIKKNKIKTVIVSGDPFLFYYASELKKKLEFNLILDYRDLWNDHSFYRNQIAMNNKQKQFFEFAENEAVNNCNKIICVDKGLESLIKNRITNKTITTHIIHNGFDSDDFKPKPSINNQKKDITIFFAGNISSDVNFIFITFFEALAELKSVNQNLFNRIKVEIIGNMDNQLISEINNLQLGNVKLENKFLSFNDYKLYAQKKRIGLIHLSKHYPDAFVTKFGDFLNLNLFTLSIGYKGEFAKFIEENNLGMHFEISANFTFFNHLEIALDNYTQPNEELLTKFNLEHLTKQLIKLF